MKADVTISRIYLDNCTIGYGKSEAVNFFTLELPDLDNEPNISCIPEGLYKCVRIVSPSLGDCFDIYNVLDRTYIRIHAGNFTRQIEGCILVGDGLTDIDKDGIVDITNSKATLEKMLAKLPKIFTLKITRG